VNVVYIYAISLFIINFCSDVPSQIVYGFAYFGIFSSDKRKDEVHLSDLKFSPLLWIFYGFFFIYCVFRSFFAFLFRLEHRHLPGTKAYRGLNMIHYYLFIFYIL
jgi:hypothetical protein